jgi:hypothetical protein
LAETAAILVLRKKAQCDLGGRRGRMISAGESQKGNITDRRSNGKRSKRNNSM